MYTACDRQQYIAKGAGFPEMLDNDDYYSVPSQCEASSAFKVTVITVNVILVAAALLGYKHMHCMSVFGI